MLHARVCTIEDVRSTRLAWTLAVALGTASPAHVVQAQQAADVGGAATEQARLNRARSLFEEGLAFIEHKQWEEAAQRFEEVLRIRTSNVVAYNLAFALVQLGRLTEAAELLRPIANDVTSSDVVGGTARQLLSEVEPKIASVTVRLTGDPTGTLVFVGSHSMPVEHQGLPVNVDPGSYEVRVEREGAVVASHHVNVGGAYPLHVDVTLGVPPVTLRSASTTATPSSQEPSPSRAGPAAAVQADEPVTHKTWFWVAGAGLVAAATATVLVLALAGGSAAQAPVKGDAGTIAGKVMSIP
jgi:hypothetical protein